MISDKERGPVHGETEPVQGGSPDDYEDKLVIYLFDGTIIHNSRLSETDTGWRLPIGLVDRVSLKWEEGIGLIVVFE